MLDLETWGTKPGSAIRSIGAVTFDPFGDGTVDEFYANISDESCAAANLTKDPSTIAWWARQSEAAQKSLLKDQQPIEKVVRDFRQWFIANKGLWVWSQGSNFDVVLWEAAHERVNVVVPWKFWDARDTRTAYEIGRLNTRTIKRAGTYHNALDDAKHQAKCVQLAYKRISVSMV
jgi:hypothetical protein